MEDENEYVPLDENANPATRDERVAALDKPEDPLEIPENSVVDPVLLENNPEDDLSEAEKLEKLEMEASLADDPEMVDTPENIDPTTVDPSIVDDIGTMDSAQGTLSDESLVGDIQGTVSQDSLAEAAQGEVSEESTVKYQMGELMDSIEAGKPLPPWASPGARKVSALMQQRGLGSSSMAGAAILQSIMESGIPIASQDAQTYATMDITNLNNRQTAALQNAATYAGMDIANLNARMQAAVTNAQAFLSIDLQNLTNDQRTREVNYQANVQAAFSNQAAENAAAQFNAKSQNDVDMFFAELGTQVATANANRAAASEQFNVSSTNAMTQFQNELNNSRDQFNTNLKFQIDSSNKEWRRNINTQNTAATNAAISQNAQNNLGLSQEVMANTWQAYRDELAWINSSSANAESRDHEITLYALQQANAMGLLDEQLENDLWRRAGQRVIDRILK